MPEEFGREVDEDSVVDEGAKDLVMECLGEEACAAYVEIQELLQKAGNLSKEHDFSTTWAITVSMYDEENPAMLANTGYTSSDKFLVPEIDFLHNAANLLMAPGMLAIGKGVQLVTLLEKLIMMMTRLEQMPHLRDREELRKAEEMLDDFIPGGH